MNGGDDRALEERRDGAGGDTKEREIEQEIVGLRNELDQMVGELDRRRHEAFDVRLQLRRHARVVAGAGAVAVILAVGGFVAWRSGRRRQRNLLVRLQNLSHAIAIRDADRP